MRFLYFFLLLFSVSYPLLKIRDPRLNYYQKVPRFLKALVPMLVVMLVWDVLFTRWGVWGFNDDYILGLKILGLPLEEILFFIAIPFACTFIYEVVIYYDSKNRFEKLGPLINFGIILISIALLVFEHDSLYTATVLTLLIILLMIHQFVVKGNYLGRYYVAFLFILIPFLFVNAILTGSFIPEQVVWYNAEDILGFRVFTIPIEDFFYCHFMMLLLISFYERFKVKSTKGKSITRT